MGLQIYGHGVAGEILVEDQRPDGSLLLLQCTPYGQPRPQVSAGITVASSEGYSWPMLQESGLAQKRLGKLHLDTTRMPAEILTFNVSILAEKAAQALDSGTRFVELTTDNAREWGYSGPAVHASSDTPLATANVNLGTDPGAGGGKKPRKE